MRGRSVLRVLVVVVLLVVSSAGICARATTASLVRGAQDVHRAHYERAQKYGLFACLDGSATLNFARVNDEECDCADCSDEPGTAACTTLRSDGTLPTSPSPEWRFQCTTREVKNHSIMHSRVNDGYCDCCDGSDEYDEHVKCPNTCDTLVAEQQREETALLQMRQRALQNKAAMRVQATQQRATAEADIPRLEAELREVTVQLEAKEPKLRPMEEDDAATQRRLDELREAWYNHTEESLLGPESQRGGCVMWRQTGNCDPAGPPEPDKDRECRELVNLGQSGYCECRSGSDAQVVRYNFTCDHKMLQCSYVCEHKGEDGIPLYLWPELGRSAPPRPTSPELSTLRAEVAKLREEQQNKAALLQKYRHLVNLTLNTEALLRTLEGQIFSFTASEHRYDLSLFEWARQCQGSNQFGINTGNWGHFASSTNSLWSKDTLDYAHMVYDGGAACDDERQRVTTVHLVCGEATKLASAEEQTVCTYSMVLETPALCDD